MDPYDVFLGKLFSGREKDRDDLRALATELDRHALEARFHRDAGALRSDPGLLEAAKANWHVLYGAPLPDGPGGE